MFSLFVLICFSPLFLFIALGILCSSKGHVLYVQPRLGKKGKIFKCYKFRTMHVHAEKKLTMLLNLHPHLKEEWQHHQKLKRDPRIFAFGKWLRKTSLDELPQFWNVVKGDLSVVGPRPYMLSQKKEMGIYTKKILSIRPGITGLWQTSGRNQTTFEQRIALDAAYLDRRCFFFDLLLILKTIPQVIFLKDGY